MSNDNYKTLCENIRFIREKSGLSHKEMAELLHIPAATQQKLEMGIITKRAKIDIVFYIEAIFKISPEDLFTKSLK